MGESFGFGVGFEVEAEGEFEVEVEAQRRLVMVGRRAGRGSSRWLQNMHAARGRFWRRDEGAKANVLLPCSVLVLRMAALRIVDWG